MSAFLSRLSWPAVAVIGLALAAIAGVVALLPDDARTEAVLGLLTVLAGLVGAAGALPSALRPPRPTAPLPRPATLSSALRDAGRDSLADELDDDETPVMGTRSRHPPPRRRGGWSGIDVAIAIVAVGVAATVLATALSGCGASAIAHHSTAAVVLGSVHHAAEGVADSAIAAEVVACAEAEECIDGVRARYLPAKVALVSVHAAVALYRESIRVAHAAQSGEALDALRLALRDILDGDVPRALAALASVGVELPAQVAAWVEVARTALVALLGGGA